MSSADLSLTFLGIGVPPDISTWGVMISNGRKYLDTAYCISSETGCAVCSIPDRSGKPPEGK